MSNRRRGRRAASDPHPFLADPGPFAAAHQGGAAERPPNTMLAFEHAVRCRYRCVELDVQLTSDGVVVVFHDQPVERATAERATIAGLAMDRVEAIDAAYAWSDDGGESFRFRGQGVRVPRFEEVLISWPELKIIVDIKDDRCVGPLARLIEEHGAWERVCFGAFADRRLRAIRELSGGRACTSMGSRAVATACLAALAGRMPRLRADCLQVPIRRFGIPILTEGFVRTARRARLPIHVWTVNDERTMDLLLDLGVEGIMTDELRLLGSVLERRGLAL